MLGNFIYTKTKDLFLQELEAGNVLNEAIVFIEDTKEIWNHGTYFSTAEQFIIPITYSELVALRDNNQLIPGILYRITDYVTTCSAHGNHYSEVNTYSAGHPFDIIVTALSENILDEHVSAALHEGDTYFSTCKISQWKIDYTIDNDTNKFRWADSTNGKGVIYYMKDEHDNECTYDFKNILYNVPSMSILGSLWVHDTTIYDTYNVGFDSSKKYYTFSRVNDSGEIEDATMVYISKTIPFALGNVIKRPNDWEYLRDLPVIVFLALPTTHELMSKYSITSQAIYHNYIGASCEFLFILAPTERNIISTCSRYNIIEPYSTRNTIGDYFCGNYMGTLMFGSNIGTSFAKNRAGDMFLANNINNTCLNNIFGELFISNSVGNYFLNNVIGNSFQINTFSEYFVSNQFRITNSQDSDILNNCILCKFDDGVAENIFYPASIKSNDTDYLCNIHVCRGVAGSSSYNYVGINNINSQHEVIISKNSNNELVEYNTYTLYSELKTDANIQAVDTSETVDDVETNTYVKYVAQTLTDEQKAQARKNIGVVVKKEIINIDTDTITLSPDKYYKNTGTYSSLNISLEESTDTTYISEYCMEFTTSDEGTSLSVPDTIKWANGIIPTLENNCIYQLSIMNNLGICTKFI